MVLLAAYKRPLALLGLLGLCLDGYGAKAYEELRFVPPKSVPYFTGSDLAQGDASSATFPPPGLPVKTTDDYQIVKRLGTGKFSDVFEAVDMNLERTCLANNAPNPQNNQPTRPSRRLSPLPDPRALVVLKCLKPVSERKIRREISILQHVSKLPNLVRLLGIVLPLEYFASNRKPTDLPKMPSLVLEHAGPGAQWLCHEHGLLLPSPVAAGGTEATQTQGTQFLSDYEIRYYLFHLLIALDGLHSVGIMHRDVKPRNILINRSSTAGTSHLDPTVQGLYRPLVLIDLGLSDFYVLHQRYNVRVASRHYKSPELLVGYEYYHYSLDLWSVGCILVGLLLRREPFFRGKDNVDQLAKIVAILGTDDLTAYLRRYNIPITSDIQSILQRNPPLRTDWASLVADGCPLPSHEAIDLLNKLLIYDHEGRLTAKQAMQHSYFDPVRDRVHAELLSYTTYLYPSSNLP